MKRSGGRRGGAIVLTALALSGMLLCLSLAEVASAAAPSKAAVTLYRLPRVPPTGGTGPLAVDQRGNVWFEETYEKPAEAPGEPPIFPGQVVRMNRQGEIAVAARLRPSGFAVAPDGGIWFTGFRGIGRIAPDGLVSTFPLPDGENEEGKVVFNDGPIVVGGDGNLWFSGARGIRDENGRASGDQPIIGRLTPSGDLAEFDLPREGGHPIRLAAGPDGNVWFTEWAGERVARIAPNGQIEGFPLSRSSRPYDIVAGFDGDLWFMEEKGDAPTVARITTAGAITEFPLESAQESFAGQIAAGPDGRIWFVSEAGSVGRLNPATRRISKVALPSRVPEELVAGPEGSLWYTSAGDPPCLPGDSVCGGAGYYQSGVIGRIDPAPLSVKVWSGRLAAGARVVKVRLSCLDGNVGQACRGKLQLRAGRAVVAKRRYALGVDLTRAVGLRLGDEARDRLLREGRLRLKCTVTLGGGRTVVRALRLRLRTHQAG